MRRAVIGPAPGAAPAPVNTGPVLTQSLLAHYATAAGGRRAYDIASAYVEIPTGTTEQPLALLMNPPDSGVDVYIVTAEFGSDHATRFRRYRGAQFTGLGTYRSGGSTCGGTVPSMLRLYLPGQYTRTPNTGTTSKTAHIGGSQQYVTTPDGAVVLRPGAATAWTIQQDGQRAFTAAVYFTYYELPAAP